MNADFSQYRQKMVDGQLRTTDVTSASVLAAMGSVPREAFVDARRRELAYIDEDIEIMAENGNGAGRYIMEPSPFAKLLQLADIRAGDVVLDIGCGTGYSAAVLSRLASSVIALESDASLAERATGILGNLGFDNAVVVHGPLRAGYAAEGPYDVIVLEGAVGEIPPALFDQLRDGGRLVAVEGYGNAGVARLYVKVDGIVTGRRAFNAAIKPLPGFERAPAFVF
jgi:protein-L-isoaspartate(D-aspartate) O-methyltransferase